MPSDAGIAVVNERSHASEVIPRKSNSEDASDTKEEGVNGSLILRIKRKRGTEPITALRIETLLAEASATNVGDKCARQVGGVSEGGPEDVQDVSRRTKRRLTDRGEEYAFLAYVIYSHLTSSLCHLLVRRFSASRDCFHRFIR
jgi:hypothetical protein